MPPDYNYSQKDLSDFLLTKVFFIGISLMIKHFAIDWNSSFLKEKIIWFNVYKAFFVNLFQANVPFLHPHPPPPTPHPHKKKPSRNQRFSDILRKYSDRWKNFHNTFHVVVTCLVIILYYIVIILYYII